MSGKMPFVRDIVSVRPSKNEPCFLQIFLAWMANLVKSKTCTVSLMSG